ncbi:MAG: hypothetical protein HZA77_08115 [Candidatus Schekmanbacteria bacterium]|nr:hypothetical protein [Candidatus Schekmanbacteria bacterium]
MMTMTLLAPDNALGFPAPYWFIVFFKVLGFTLHMVPMNIWYAGIITMLLLRKFGGENGKRLSDRVLNAMPVIISIGVNFGIVPLLFTQVAYYKVFYPATILMAWPWFSIFILLTAAYYGVYYYVVGLRSGTMTGIKYAVGWVSAISFMLIGFLFANSFSLMTNIGAWEALWKANSIGGASLGTALNIGDPVLIPRWLMMFGLAITTTAAYVIIDSGFFAGSEKDNYKKWTSDFALKMYLVGILWFAAAGSWYFFGAINPAVRAHQLGGNFFILTALTAVAPGIPFILILLFRKSLTKGKALAIGLAQFIVLALNAISRQIVQNKELSAYLDVTGEKVNIQWSPLIIFLILFVIGVGIVVWMVMQVAKSPKKAEA